VGLYKEEAEPEQGGKNQRTEKSTQKNRVKKKAEKTEHKSKYTEKERTRGQDTVRRIILEIVSEPANKEKPGFSQRTLTTSRNLLCSFRSYREIKKESTDKYSQKENQRSIRRKSSSSAASISVSRSSIFGLQKQHLRSPEAGMTPSPLHFHFKR